MFSATGPEVVPHPFRWLGNAKDFKKVAVIIPAGRSAVPLFDDIGASAASLPMPTFFTEGIITLRWIGSPKDEASSVRSTT
jgi:hypothetical protein